MAGVNNRRWYNSKIYSLFSGMTIHSYFLLILAEGYEISNLVKDFRISRFPKRFPDFRRDFQISGEIFRFPKRFPDFWRDCCELGVFNSNKSGEYRCMASNIRGTAEPESVYVSGE